MSQSALETTLIVPQGNFTLSRLPARRNELLRAWDAADEYLLNTLAEQSLLFDGARLLIVNDSFGALAVALSDYLPFSMSDSWLCHEATRRNLQANGIDTKKVNLLDALSEPPHALDIVLFKVPKTLALLEDELIRLAPWVTEETCVIVAGMVKLMPSSVWQLLERLWGSTSTSLAKKKAKLIFVTPEHHHAQTESPYPVCYQLDGTPYRICNHANVFSRDSLDIGTRVFLQHLPEELGECEAVDLGCGNGVVGLMVAARNPQAKLHFVDESFMAVASARQNFIENLGAERQAFYHVADALSDFPHSSIDLVFCNPPFHQGNVVGDQTALQMFRQAKRVLRPGGELWVVGNRHLGYHKALRKIFSDCELLSSNSKFVILRATV